MVPHRLGAHLHFRQRDLGHHTAVRHFLGLERHRSVAVQLLKTVITGGVSMVIFFFIFLIIFPDMNKVAKKARAKVENLKASGASAFDILMAEYEANVKEEEALLANTRKDKFKLASQATSKSVAYTVMLDKIVLAENKRKHYEYMKDQFVAGMKASGADMNSEANKAASPSWTLRSKSR